MRRFVTVLMLAAWLAPAPFIVGCDETVSHEKTVKEKSDGTMVKDEKKVTQSPDGTVTKTEEKKVVNP